MAYVISGACISCGSCAGECPVGAIAEGDGKYEINADACIDCGSCAGSSFFACGEGVRRASESVCASPDKRAMC